MKSPKPDFIAVASQLWCKPEHSSHVMDAMFCQSVIAALEAAYSAGRDKGIDESAELPMRIVSQPKDSWVMFKCAALDIEAAIRELKEKADF